MKSTAIKTAIACGLLLAHAALWGGAALGQEPAAHAHGDTRSGILGDIYGEKLGTVHFRVSCAEPARHQAKRGLALLHHMTY